MPIFSSFVLVFFLTSIPALADECYMHERDAITKKNFTETDYVTALENWLSQEPESPGLITLWRAYNLYKQEAPQVELIKGDKRKHCYIGCRLSQSISYEAAKYAAWYKEYQDLTDCDKNSSFEERDYEYTLIGANIGTISNEDLHCFDTCSAIER